MIETRSSLLLRPQSLSRPALLTAALVHIALLWIFLQSTPVAQVTRQVVYQMLTPITPVTRAPDPPPRPKPVVVQPPPTRTAAAAPPPVREPIAPIATLSIAPPKKKISLPVVKKIARVPDVAEPLRPLQPVQELQEAAPARAIPVTEPVVVALPEPVPTPAPTPAPPPAVAALPDPGPRNDPPAAPPVPPAPLTAVATPRPAAITPTEVHAGGAAGDGATAPAVPGGPGGANGFSGSAAYGNPYRLPRGSRQKSYAEMANEQLNPGGARDALAAGMQGSERPDCVNSGQAVGLLAPALIAYNVARDKCK
jgi:hypothetical protein